MDLRRFHQIGRFLMVATVSLLATDVAGNASASVNEREFLLDKYDVTTDHKELAEFKRLLVFMDDALRKDAVERYLTLNQRLHLAMQRELEQTRSRLASLRSGASDVPGNVMRANTMGDGFGFTDAPNLVQQNRELRRRAALRRVQKMEALIDRVGELEYGLQQGNGNSTTRNAALLDQFLKLMREDISDIEKEIRERKSGE